MEKRIAYRNSAMELSEIFKYIDESIREKIPAEIIEHYESIKNTDYTFEIDKTTSLDNQKLMPETINILGYIYLKYCCEEDERSKIVSDAKAKRKMNDEKINAKYNFELLRKDSDNTNVEKATTVEETSITTVDKENWFLKFIKKIKLLFCRK